MVPSEGNAEEKGAGWKERVRAPLPPKQRAVWKDGGRMVAALARSKLRRGRLAQELFFKKGFYEEPATNRVKSTGVNPGAPTLYLLEF